MASDSPHARYCPRNLEEDGVYPNLYYGMNLLKTVPQDLYLQDLWYRTSFVAPAAQPNYWLEFPGINYRSEIQDDLGPASNDQAFDLQQVVWADMTPLNSMQQVPLEIKAEQTASGDESRVTIHLHNASKVPAFFERAEITATRGGEEILPIQYDDNYVTVFPGETVEIHGEVQASAGIPTWIKLTGYNAAEESAPIGK